MPCKRRHGPALLLGEFEQMMLFRMILDKPGIYLSEIQDEFMRISAFTSASRLFAGLLRLWDALIKLCIE